MEVLELADFLRAAGELRTCSFFRLALGELPEPEPSR